MVLHKCPTTWSLNRSWPALTHQKSATVVWFLGDAANVRISDLSTWGPTLYRSIFGGRRHVQWPCEAAIRAPRWGKNLRFHVGSPSGGTGSRNRYVMICDDMWWYVHESHLLCTLFSQHVNVPHTGSLWFTSGPGLVTAVQVGFLPDVVSDRFLPPFSASCGLRMDFIGKVATWRQVGDPMWCRTLGHGFEDIWSMSTAIEMFVQS